MNRNLLNKDDQIDVKEILDSLHENVGYSQEEAIRFCKDTLLDKFKKNFFPALDYLQKKYRYKKSYIDSMYSSSSRWYAELHTKEVSENIKFNTIIKISTIYEVSPGELVDFIISFDKKKK